MNEPTMDKLVQRLDRLERENRRLKIFEGIAVVTLICLSSVQLYASEIVPFTAECVEGETHRYDGGNGKDMMGNKIQDPRYGWSTEKWGSLSISWSGGKTIIMGQLNAKVMLADGGVISAVWAGSNPLAQNIYSLVLDTILGQAVYSQVQATSLGENRSVKVRSENFYCKINWVN